MKDISYIRKIRVEYYQVVTGPKDLHSESRDRLFDLEALLAKADTMSLEDRTFDYYQEDARLDKLKYMKAYNCWYLNFIRLRQTKIPSKAKKNTASVPIELANDEFIGEEVTAVYDITNHILVLQRNKDSLSSTAIESYLSELYAEAERDVYLRPIKPLDLGERLRRAREFRKLTIRFANIPTAAFNGNQNSSFKSLLDYFSSFTAQSATITLSLGHRKQGSLALDAIRETVNLINENHGLVSAAELNVKNSFIDPVDTIDLFSLKSHDFISIKLKKLETIDYLELAERIQQKYKKSQAELLNALNR